MFKSITSKLTTLCKGKRMFSLETNQKFTNVCNHPDVLNTAYFISSISSFWLGFYVVVPESLKYLTHNGYICTNTGLGLSEEKYLDD